MSEPSMAEIVERQIAEVLAYPEFETWLQTEPEVKEEVVYGFPKDTYEHQVYAVRNNHYENLAKEQAEEEKRRAAFLKMLTEPLPDEPPTSTDGTAE